MATERAMMGVIAPEDIVEVKQNQTSSLMKCSNGDHVWTGHMFVTLVPRVDGPTYVEKIKKAWTGRDDWQVSERTTATGELEVEITNPAGYSHGVYYSVNRHTVQIASFSPCFAMDPPYEYGIDY